MLYLLNQPIQPDPLALQEVIRLHAQLDPQEPLVLSRSAYSQLAELIVDDQINYQIDSEAQPEYWI